MGIGAILAGAAGGISDAWEDQREAAAAEATRAFQERLEETRVENSRALMSEERGYQAIADEKTRAYESEEAEKDRRYKSEEGQKDRASLERRAGSTAERVAKLDPMVKARIDATTKEMENISKSMESGMLSPEQTESLSKRHTALKKDLDNMLGRDITEEAPGPSKSALSRLFSSKGSAEELAGFDRAFNLPEGTAQKLYSENVKGEPEAMPEEAAKKEVKEGKRGILGSAFLPEGIADSLKKRQDQAPDVIASIKQAVDAGASVDDYVDELSSIAQDMNIDDAIRDEARKLLSGMTKPAGVY